MRCRPLARLAVTHLHARPAPRPVSAFRARAQCDGARAGLAGCAPPGVGAPLAFRLERLRWQDATGIGAVEVDLLQPQDARAAAALISRAYAGTPEAAGYSSILPFVEEVLTAYPTAVCLVARLQGESNAGSSHLPLPDTIPQRMVGFVTLDLDAPRRLVFGKLRPPVGAAYLSNMAVDVKFRRQGVARALLRACEDAAAGAGTTRLCLMARAGDERAVTLYHSAGYEFCGQDGSRWWQRLLFMVPKVLMCKAL